MLITCLSGMQLELRKWKLSDMEEMAEVAETAPDDGEVLSLVCARSLTRVVDPGPYAFVKKDASTLDWMRVAKVDVLHTIHRARAGSFPGNPEIGTSGEDYTLDVECPFHQDASGQTVPYAFIWKIRLCDLPTKPIPPRVLEVMRKGESLSTTLSNGTELRFHLPSLGGERDAVALARRMGRKVRPSDLVAGNLVSISGRPDCDIATRARFVADLDLDLLAELRTAIQQSSGSIAITTGVKCKKCGRVRDTRIPFGPTFFLPADPDETPTPEPQEAPPTT
jgi:hypothetical protein